MEGIIIEVNGNIARIVDRPQKITSGTVGMTAVFTFDSVWDGLGKTAVFMACDVKRIVPVVDSEVVIPWEVLEKPNVWLSVGVYGTNTDGTLVIPTSWVNVCVIRAGATAEGDPSADPTPPVWDQLNAEIEKLKDAIENGGGAPGDGPGGGGKDGEDGFSPIAKVTQTFSGAVITITDANGTTAATVTNGKDGKDGTTGRDGKDGVDGYSPSAIVSEIEGGAILNITDKQGSTSVFIQNGKDGEPGSPGPAGADGATVEEVLAAMPKTSVIDFANLENGSFTETVDGQTVTHAVTYDADGRPIAIDGITIGW